MLLKDTFTNNVICTSRQFDLEGLRGVGSTQTSTSGDEIVSGLVINAGKAQASVVILTWIGCVGLQIKVPGKLRATNTRPWHAGAALERDASTWHISDLSKHGIATTISACARNSVRGASRGTASFECSRSS
jgi:hypothetical protein